MYKMKTELPQALKRAIRRSVLKRVIPCLIAEAILAVCLALWGKTLFSMDGTIARASCYLAVLLIPFAVTGIPLKLFDRSWRGTVQKVEIETTVDNATPTQPTRNHNYIKNTIRLAIIRDDGKWMYQKAYEGRAKLRQNLEKYKEGDEVFHLYGTDHIIVLPQSADSQVECAYCGDMNDKTCSCCRNCGCELIVK